MTKVVFVQNIWYEYLGIEYMASVLKQNGHECEVIFGTKPQILDQIQKSQPDIIAFSVMTIPHLWALDVIRYLKKNNIKALFLLGGPHVTFSPEFIEEHEEINLICRGEGEYAMLDLANAIQKDEDYTKIHNFWVRKNGVIHKNSLRPLITNLDELPFPDRGIYRKYPFFASKTDAVFMAMRGCWFKCSYCFNHAWNREYGITHRDIVRHRSYQNIFDEIDEVKKKYKIKTAMFIDSTFNIDKKWAIGFFQEYANHVDVPFSVNIRANPVDEELIKSIADTGLCASVRCGIEVGSERLRNGLLKKGLSNENIKKAVSLFKKYNLNIITFNMFGLPTETLEESYETIRMNQEIKPKVVSCLVFVPYPGLDITNYALENGLMEKEDFAKLNVSPYKTHRSVIKQKEIKRVENLHKFSILAIRFPWMEPIINHLIKLPPNKVYDHIYNVTQAYEWMKWLRIGPIRMAKEILKNYKETI